MKRSADHFEKALAKVQEHGGAAYSSRAVEKLNQRLIESERAFLDENGLPERPWFKNQIYAPGAYTGYGVKTLPGVREAIEERHWKEADEQIEIAARGLERFSAEIEKATALVRQTR